MMDVQEGIYFSVGLRATWFWCFQQIIDGLFFTSMIDRFCSDGSHVWYSKKKS